MGKFGRPTTYDDDTLEKSLEYLEWFNTEYNDRPDNVKDEVIPSIVGLCRYIRRARSTVYKWAKEEGKEDFSDILEQIEDCQHLKLTFGGLVGNFNSTITKLMLTKHGYSEKMEVDNTSSDGSHKNFNDFYDKD